MLDKNDKIWVQWSTGVPLMVVMWELVVILWMLTTSKRKMATATIHLIDSQMIPQEAKK